METHDTVVQRARDGYEPILPDGQRRSAPLNTARTRGRAVPVSARVEPGPVMSYPNRPAGFHRRPSTLTVVITSLLFMMFGIWLFMITTPDLDWGGDSAMYLMHARNLARGAAYNLSGYIQNPWAYLAPQSYPPGFPLLLARPIALWGLNILALKQFVAGLVFIGGLVFARQTRIDFPRGVPGTGFWLLAVAAALFNPLFLQITLALNADTLFFVTVCASLLALDRAMAPAARHTVSPAHLLAGLLIAAACLTRVFGLMLPLTVVVFELIRHRRPTRGGLVCVGLALLVYEGVKLLIAHDSVPVSAGTATGYGHLFVEGLWDHAAALPRRVVDSAKTYIYLMSDYLVLQWPGSAPPAELAGTRAMLLLCCLVPAAVGYGLQCGRRFGPREVFVMLYVLSLLPWGVEASRYLMPVVPFYFFYSALALAVGLQRWRGAACLVIFILAGLLTLTYTARYQRQLEAPATTLADAPNGPDAMALYRFIRHRTALDAVIAYRKPRIVNLYTDRAATTYEDAKNPMPADARVLQWFAQVHVGYVLSSSEPADDDIRGLIARHPARFVRIYKNPRYTLYRMTPTATGVSNPGFHTP